MKKLGIVLLALVLATVFTTGAWALDRSEKQDIWGDYTLPFETNSNVLPNGSANYHAIEEVLKAEMEEVTGRVFSVRLLNGRTMSDSVLAMASNLGSATGNQVKFYAETTYEQESEIQGVIYFRADKLSVSGEINTGVWVDWMDVKAVRDTFEKYYNNKIEVVYLDQEGGYGGTVEIAADVNLHNLNTKTLVLYSYNAGTGKYSKITEPNISIDDKGMLHFNTDKGGYVIVTDKELARK